MKWLKPSRVLLLASALAFAIVSDGFGVQDLKDERQGVTGTNAGAANRPGLLAELNTSLETLVANVSPAVVQIQVSGYGPREERGVKDVSIFSRQHSLGSGVIVDPSGYIITNGHVVEGAQSIRVILPTPPMNSALKLGLKQGQTLKAKLVGLDAESDLAVIKVDGTHLPTLELGNSQSVRQGQLVVAIGSPEGLPSSATMGIVSSPLRQPDHDDAMVYIQTDAPINPGNSGGPLVDIHGRLVGINTMILSQGGGSEGLGFAIPVGVVRTVYQSLRTYGHVHRPEIGATFQEITPELATGLELSRSWGAITGDVAQDGPAQTAGLKAGDIVLSIDGRSIAGVPGCRAALYLHSQEQPLDLVVLRGKRTIKLSVPFVEHHDQLDDLAKYANFENALVPKLGVFAVDLDDKMRSLLGSSSNDETGVLVVAGAATEGAPNTGLKPGDFVKALNLAPVTSLQQLRDKLASMKSNDAVVLQIKRDGKLQYLAFNLDDN
jgi:serine protease Do